MKNIQIPVQVRAVCMALENEGFEAWVVGGCVRDTLLGRIPSDWDVTTNATPEEATAIFTGVGYRVEPTGVEHGTITVIVGNAGGISTAVEVTTFRGDGEYTDGRRPDSVTFVDDIEEDLARRDFTINAMAFRPATSDFCDPFGGKNDLKIKSITAVGDPRERFMEDGLRVLRACRFSAQLGFFIEAKTQEAMSQTPVREKCLGVAKERIFNEICKLMVGQWADHGLHAMSRAGLVEALFPGVWLSMRGVAFPQAFRGLMGSNEERTFRVRMAGLLVTLGADAAGAVMNKLRLPTADNLAVVNLIRGYWSAPVGPGAWSTAGVRDWLMKVGKNEATLALALLDAFGEVPGFVTMAHAVLETNPPVSISELALNGTEVAEILAIKPGKAVGEALRFLLSQVIMEPEMNKPHRLTKVLMQHAAEFRR